MTIKEDEWLYHWFLSIYWKQNTHYEMISVYSNNSVYVWMTGFVKVFAGVIVQTSFIDCSILGSFFEVVFPLSMAEAEFMLIGTAKERYYNSKI